ncbi:1-acyl-sn-glycerol-3-phosphate acyltransferase [Patescibacteria group bacterium]|nr:1-acyl-sn-glycerol-3-phosphate acyltransferase [Patescibacteria group bacterium]
MQKLRSFLFWILFASWTAFITVPFWFLWVCPRHWLVKHLNWWARGVMLILKITVDVRYEVLDGHLMPKRGPALIIANHQSTWDTIIFHTICGGDPCFVMKRVLFWIPFYGLHALKMGMVGINRGKNGATSWKNMLRKIPSRLKRGQAVIIFPEGTRVRPGEWRDYHSGAFHVARCSWQDSALQTCPVIPAALDSGKCWPKIGWRLRPGTIRLRFLPPVPRCLGRDEFMRRLEESIRAAEARLD